MYINKKPKQYPKFNACFTYTDIGIGHIAATEATPIMRTSKTHNQL